MMKALRRNSAATFYKSLKDVPMRRLLFVATAHLLMLMIGCGQSNDNSDTSEVLASVEGSHHAYVFSRMLVPATSQQQQDYSLDLGGTGSSTLDGFKDNRLGNAFVMFANLGVGLQAIVSTGVDRGVIITLADLQTTGFTNTAEAGLRLLTGTNPQPPACNGDSDKICRHHLDGNATFTVDPGAPTNDAVTGPIINGTFTTNPANLSLPIALSSVTRVTMSLTNARVKATAISDAGMTAVIGGLLPVSEINDTILPAIYPQLALIVDRDCPAANRKPPGCNCTGAGARILQLLDNAPRNCVVSLNELINNQSVKDALRPDVCSKSSCPGAPDSVSFGFQIQTVKGTFPLTGGDPGLPPDPVSVAPPLDRSVPTSVVTATSFLYSGPSPIQTGVNPATIDAQRVAAVRGRVTGRNDAPVSGATVTVLGHPELGQTLTRTDGAYDLVTNGGGVLIIAVRKDGYLQAQRTVDVPWQDYISVPEIVLVQPDPVATQIDLGGSGMKVARASTVTDASGSRRATLFVRPDTVATVAGDSGTEVLPTLTVHLTEFTTGANGPQAMPGSLPPTSAYTYAVEITVDEAHGHSVQLSQPAFLYLENFLGFAPGTGMPVGAYDGEQGRWVGLPNGIVLKVLAITNGMADIDSNGDGLADDAATLAALGLTDLERQTLATLYTAGQVLWRSPVPHFSAIDCNRPFRLPGDARFPGLGDPRGPGGNGVDDGCNASGSIIQCHNQTLGEDIPVHGTPYFLHYQSDRQAGRQTDYSTEIQLSDGNVPASVTSIVLEVRVAGRVFRQTFPPTLNQKTVFTWDGVDAYGRLTQGRQATTISVGYVYRPTYADPETTGQQFGQYPGSSIDREPSPVGTREEVTIFQTWKTALGPWDPLPLGLGGFTINPHHSYDIAGKILYAGNGDTQRASTLGQVVAQQVSIPHFSASGGFEISPGTDGNYYIADGNMRIVYDQTLRIVAGISTEGNPPCNVSNDDGPATQAALCQPKEVVAAADGAIYINDAFQRILRVTPDGLIHTVAGRGPASGCQPSGVGGPARDAQLCGAHGLVVARDGALYFTQELTHRIFKVGVDGFLSVVAGTGAAGFSGDGGSALQAMLSSPSGLSLGPDGSLVVADAGNLRVRRITTDGVITTIAGTGASGQTGDGGPATSATFQSLAGIAVGPDGAVYIPDPQSHRYRVINPQGAITAFAGNGTFGGGACGGGPPTDAGLGIVSYVSTGADGAVYLKEPGRSIFCRVVSALPTFSLTQLVIPSTSGGELYVFDNTGRHLRTVDAYTGAIRLSFAYDAAGRLSSLTSVDGQVTTIERNASGGPTAIVGPFGQRTTLELDSNGYLKRVVDPASGVHAFTYVSRGLLSTYTDPRNGVHHFSHDSLGRLTADEDPGHGTQTLSRAGDSADSTVTLTTPLGRTTKYRIQRQSSGQEIWSNTFADGTQLVMQRDPNGTVVSTSPDGTITTQKLGPDPRFGMLSPVPISLTVRTPSGLVQTQETHRTAILSNPDDPTSLVVATETFTLNGKTFTRTYNAAQKTVTVRSPLGRQSVATVNNENRIVSVVHPAVTVTQVAYDSLGRITTVGHGSRQATVTYDTNGYVNSALDSLSLTTTYDHDPLGQVTQLHMSDGNVLTSSYDAASDLLMIRPPGRTDHRVARDILGQIRSYFAPDVGMNTSETTYSYNADHQLTAITAPDGVAVVLDYDTAGRLHRLTSPDGPLEATYDTAGRVGSVDAPGGVSVVLGYDGSLVTAETWTGPIPGQRHITYNTDFRVASERINSESAITAAYDDDGLMTRVGALTIARNAATGRPTQTTIGSLTETYSFSNLGELSSSAATCGGTMLRAISLTRDNAGQITAQDATTLGQTDSLTYDHDSRGWLTGVHHGGVSSTYTYDSNGNRLSANRPALISYDYDAQDRLVQQGSTAYLYTASGQLKSKTEPSGTTSYHYDLFGNLRSAQLADGRSISYVVDGMNRRIGKSIDGAIVQGFLYGGGGLVIAELDASGAVISRFVYGTRSNVPDYMIKAGVTYRILSDVVGSPRLIVNIATCQVVQRVDYDEFGRITSDTSPGFQPFGFAGGLLDRDTGLIRFGARDYDPEIGRWTAKDPAGFRGGDANLYVYAGNNPVNFIDPAGLGFWQGLTDLSAGFGDKISFGLTRWVRKKLGVNDVVNPCSGLYTVGGVSGEIVLGVLLSGVSIEEAVAERALVASDIGLSGKGITELAGTVLNAGTTRVVNVANIAATRGALAGELRSALPNMLNAARAEGVQTLQVTMSFANERLSALVASQAERYGGTFSSVGGQETITFILEAL